MRLRSLVLISVAATVGVTSNAHAQNGAPVPAAPVPAFPVPGNPADFGPRFGSEAGRKALLQMQTGLRQLATAEERYFSDHGTYTTDLAALGLYTKGHYAADREWVQVIFAGGRGWTGMATHRSIPGKSCVIYVGYGDELPGGLPATHADHRTPRDEGAPRCDDAP